MLEQFIFFSFLIASTAGAGTISVSPGWNLVSARSSITAKDTLSNAESFISVWKWDNNNWSVYLLGEDDSGAAYAESKGFELLDQINPGEGFWVNTTQEITLN